MPRSRDPQGDPKRAAGRSWAVTPDALDGTVELKPDAVPVAPALPFVAAKPGQRPAPAVAKEPVKRRRPPEGEAEADPLDGTQHLGPETTRRAAHEPSLPFGRRRSRTVEMDGPATRHAPRVVVKPPPLGAPSLPGAAPAAPPVAPPAAPPSPPSRPRATAATPAPIPPTPTGWRGGMAAPVAPGSGLSTTPAPASRRAKAQAVIASPPEVTRPEPVAVKERPAIPPQEMRRLARALDELCTKEDGGLDAFLRRRAAGSSLTREDVSRMRDVLRWFAELLPSADDDERRRLAEVWRIVGPVVGTRR